MAPAAAAPAALILDQIVADQGPNPHARACGSDKKTGIVFEPEEHSRALSRHDQYGVSRQYSQRRIEDLADAFLVCVANAARPLSSCSAIIYPLCRRDWR